WSITRARAALCEVVTPARQWDGASSCSAARCVSLVVEQGDVRDADDRAFRRLQPGNRLAPRFLPRWVQQFVAGLLEFLCCWTYGRGGAHVEFDVELRHRMVRRPLRS